MSNTQVFDSSTIFIAYISENKNFRRMQLENLNSRSNNPSELVGKSIFWFSIFARLFVLESKKCMLGGGGS